MEREKKKLGEYHRKRKGDATNEPFGTEALPQSAAGSLSGAFVVHLHDATRRHYDVRLEIGGVLASFAVPRGPSLDPSEKHLAVKTEDHPIEYLDFEDVIPKGQYGAGPMIAWDRGFVEYLEGPAEDEIAQGKLHVELRGLKLRGRWALVKLAKSVKGNEWLMFKKDDGFAAPSRNIVDELPRSVLSGLTVEELEDAKQIGGKLVARVGPRRAETAHVLAPKRSPLLAPAARREALPSLYDPELDGVRILATREGDVVALHHWGEGGTGERIEAFYPEIVRALRALPIDRIALDGELVTFDPNGRPNVRLLEQRARRILVESPHLVAARTPAILIVSDVLVLGHSDARPLPLEERRAILASLLPGSGYLRAPAPLDGDEQRILAACAELGIATVIAKAKGSPYDASTSPWARVSTGIAPRSRVKIEHPRETAPVSRRVTMTNREKIFWPAEGYTKGDLIDYYAATANVLLPYIVERPIILVRYPDGIEGKSFFQWNVPPGMPPWVRTLEVPHEDEREGKRRGFLVDDASTLIYIANLACIPLHVLAARVPRLHEPDFLTIDFDVKQSELRHAVTLAQALHELLGELGMAGYPKTSGQSGLHVLIPLGPGQTFETARALADLLGRLLVENHPEIATMERVVAKRGPRVYVDTGQTGTTRAIVAPYSVRAVAGATVSAPLAWSEVTAKLDPSAFTIKTMARRIETKGDLLAGLLEAKPDVAGVVERLVEIVPKSVGRRSPGAPP